MFLRSVAYWTVLLLPQTFTHEFKKKIYIFFFFACEGTTTKPAVTTKGLDIEAQGTINGIPVYEFDLDSIKNEDKPWRKPGLFSFRILGPSPICGISFLFC